MSSAPASSQVYATAVAIATSLLERGERCSVRQVRELAKGGSFSTICKAVAAAKAQRGDAPSPDLLRKDKVEAPPELESIRELAGQVKSLAAELQGVRKYFLLQVEEARAQAAQWKAKYRTAEDEKGQLETMRRQQVAALREEIAWLQGSQGLERATRARSPGPVAPAPPLMTRVPDSFRYPGHPRAVSGPLDATDGAE